MEVLVPPPQVTVQDPHPVHCPHRQSTERGQHHCFYQNSFAMNLHQRQLKKSYFTVSLAFIVAPIAKAIAPVLPFIDPSRIADTS